MKNSMKFINALKVLHAGPEDILISSDILSLITMVPTGEALRLLSRHFDEDILRFFHHVLISSFFWFNGQFYKETDGVAMGSPLSPATANFFMEHFEETALEGASHKPLWWFCYVDDTCLKQTHAH
jgi:hypothetical protein